jgi:hypothetical protein
LRRGRRAPALRAWNFMVNRRRRWAGFGVLALAWAHGGLGCDDDERPCTDMIQQAESAIEAAQAHADRACTQDGDCFIFDFAIRCIQQCSSGLGAAAISAEPTLEAEHAALEKRDCTQLARPDCQRYLAENIPSCAPINEGSEAVCLNGKCELCGAKQCLLEDEMQICTRVDRELRDCQALGPPR